MVSIPAATPVITPPVTVAIEVLVELQLPPVAEAVKVVAAPAHTVVVPDKEADDGARKTEILVLADTEPQLLVTV